jgi:thiaminase
MVYQSSITAVFCFWGILIQIEAIRKIHYMIPSKQQDKFIENIQSNLSKSIDMILDHSYIVALENKEISREKLEIFVYEQYHIISNDRRNFALMISKASYNTAMELFLDCLFAEVNALKNLLFMAEELGISRSKLESYEPLAGCYAYTNYLTRLAVYGSDAEILTAILIDLPVWGANCSKISFALKKNYDFTNDSCTFLDKFVTPLSEEFINKSNGLIISSLPLKEKEIYTAARLILDYELSFWNTIYKHSIIK